MARTPVQHYLPKLMRLIEEGSIDPSFVFLADRVGWRVAYLCMGALMLPGMAAAVIAPEPASDNTCGFGSP
jgi:hypothetical protein